MFLEALAETLGHLVQIHAPLILQEVAAISAMAAALVWAEERRLRKANRNRKNQSSEIVK